MEYEEVWQSRVRGQRSDAQIQMARELALNPSWKPYSGLNFITFPANA